jgi:hypothetical protein
LGETANDLHGLHRCLRGVQLRLRGDLAHSRWIETLLEICPQPSSPGAGEHNSVRKPTGLLVRPTSSFHEYGSVSAEAQSCCPDRKSLSCRPCGCSFHFTANDQTTRIVQRQSGGLSGITVSSWKYVQPKRFENDLWLTSAEERNPYPLMTNTALFQPTLENSGLGFLGI